MAKNKHKRGKGTKSKSKRGPQTSPGKRDEPSIDMEVAGEETGGVTTVGNGGGKLTLEAIDAISDEEENDSLEEEKVGVRRRAKGAGGVDEMEADGDGGGDDEEAEEWNAEARALRQAIAEGAFDKIPGIGGSGKGMGRGGRLGGGGDGDDAEDGSVDEVVLEEDEDEDDESLDGEDDPQKLTGARGGGGAAPVNNTRALLARAAEIEMRHEGMPWAETFAVVPPSPLPFREDPLEVHDDLKREVAFYSAAMEAVTDARGRCREAGVKFARPDDFFAEMVKSDDHMAKVKDRLIFETKKMQAFDQRRSNKEHKLRAKETRANKVADKAQRKKDHMVQVAEWAESARGDRSSGARGRVIPDDEEDRMRLRNMQGGAKSKKRLAADRKYGFGGKRGRFKQTDPDTLNDMSDFNPRGKFGGTGSRKGAKDGSGANRRGKRARDAARSRR